MAEDSTDDSQMLGNSRWGFWSDSDFSQALNSTGWREMRSAEWGTRGWDGVGWMLSLMVVEEVLEGIDGPVVPVACFSVIL